MSLEAGNIVIRKAPESLLAEKPARTLDVKGFVCPYPSLETLKALSGMRSGEVLEVITDSKPSAEESIPIVCQNRGYPFIVLKDEGFWRLRIKKP